MGQNSRNKYLQVDNFLINAFHKHEIIVTLCVTAQIHRTWEADHGTGSQHQPLRGNFHVCSQLLFWQYSVIFIEEVTNLYPILFPNITHRKKNRETKN